MKELLPRERFIRTLRREPVDRVSTLYRMKAEAKQKIARVFGIEKRGHRPQATTRRSSCGSETTRSSTRSGSTPTSPTARSRSARPGTTTSAWATARAASKAARPRRKSEFMKTQEFWGAAKVVPENFPKIHPIKTLEA